MQEHSRLRALCLWRVQAFYSLSIKAQLIHCGVCIYHTVRNIKYMSIMCIVVLSNNMFSFHRTAENVRINVCAIVMHLSDPLSHQQDACDAVVPHSK